MRHPPAEVDIDIVGVRRLLETHCPEFAREPIRQVGEGWDNFIFLVGEQHAARLPRRKLAVVPLLNEQRWLPILAPRLPLEVPLPVHTGKPGREFPWPWSVVKWIPGHTAENHRFSRADVDLLAAALRALHEPTPGDAPLNPFRGVPLQTRTELVEQRLATLRGQSEVDTAGLRTIWSECCAAPESTARCWLHGDLHPLNAIVRDGSFVGLIDWGDLSGGDVATDLACAWTLLEDPATRRRFFKIYGASGSARARARGWALHLGLALAASGEPRYLPLGLATLRRVVADA